MVSRVVLAVAAVAASVGMLLYGMGTSYSPEDDGMKSLGIYLTVAGLIGVAAGIGLYKKSETSLESEARTRYGHKKH